MLVYQMTERIFLSCLGGTVFSVLLMFIAQVSGQVSRLFVLLFAALAFALLSIVRILICKVFKKVRAFQIPVLIVGAGKTADLVVHQVRRDAGMRYRILGFLEDRKPFKDYGPNMPILGGFDDLEKAAKETGVDTILIAAPGLPQDKLSDLIYRAQSLVKHVAVVPNLVAVPMSNVSVESFFDAKIMVLHIKNNLDNPWNRLLKRLFDIAATIVGGILISPILLIIAIWVYHDSPGPVIFKHRRVGKDGKEFNCYKFRSMCVNSKEVLEHLLATDPAAKAEWDKEFKLKDDPRITRSGAFLRKTSLDELPQLWNVLKGEMSLVGPRPIVRSEMALYGKYIKEYKMVRPGITGIWQTSGRSNIDYPERVQMDNWYVHNWSVWLDLVLLWRTIGVVMACDGAY
jgi:undecaprenyl-phosphate galactose phosphotransferase